MDSTIVDAAEMIREEVGDNEKLYRDEVAEFIRELAYGTEVSYRELAEEFIRGLANGDEELYRDLAEDFLSEDGPPRVPAGEKEEFYRELRAPASEIEAALREPFVIAGPDDPNSSHGVPLYEPTADSPREPTPPGFAGDLRPVQGALLHGMLELEGGRVVRSRQGYIKFYPNAAWLAEVPAAGKTALFIALVLKGVHPIPRARRIRLGAPAGWSPSWHGFDVFREHELIPAGQIPATLVICSTTVYDHWCAETKRFGPGLQVLRIANCRQFEKAAKEAQAAVRAGMVPLSNYHMVILRVSSGSAKKYPLGCGMNSGTLPTLSALNALTFGYTWSRTVIDDFDTIKALGVRDVAPSSNFVWYVSATFVPEADLRDLRSLRAGASPMNNSITRGASWGIPVSPHPASASESSLVPHQEPRRRHAFRSFCATTFAAAHELNIKATSLITAVYFGDSPCMFLRRSRIICHPEFSKSTLQTSKYFTRRVRTERDAADYIAEQLGGGDSTAQALIQAGAYSEAAKRMGFRAEGPVDFVRNALASAIATFTSARERVEMLSALAPRLPAICPPARAKRDPKSTMRALDRLTATLIGNGRKPQDLTDGEIRAAVAECAFGDPPADWGKVLAEQKEAAEEGLERARAPLERLRSCLEADECSSCAVPYEKAANVVHCCQRIMCDECLFEGDGITRRLQEDCPFCQKPLNPKMLSRLELGAAQGSEFDGIAAALHDIEVGTGESKADESEAGGSKPDKSEAGTEKGGGAGAEPRDAPDMDRRVRAFFAYIRGDDLSSCDYVLSDETGADLHTPGLLDSGADLPLRAGSPRRFLVFVLVPEIERFVTGRLQERLPNVFTLAGSYLRRADMKRSFLSAAGDSYLVAAVTTDCAGMDLPQVTDLIFIGTVPELGLRRQAISRALRTGRTSNLQIVEFV